MLSNVTLSARQIGSRHQKRLVAGTEECWRGLLSGFPSRVTAAVPGMTCGPLHCGR